MDFYRLLALTLSIAPLGLANAGPTSMTREALKEYPDGASYWEVDVTCSTARDPRTIQRKDNSKTWCAKEAPDLCRNDKIAIASRVCSARYRTALADEAAQPEETSEAALPTPEETNELERQKDQLSVERERLSIEQQRLELRRQEIELKKEELRLKNLLEEANRKPAEAKPKPVEKAKEDVASNDPKTSKVPTLFRTKDAGDPQ